jgi:hypothetical protein
MEINQIITEQDKEEIERAIKGLHQAGLICINDFQNVTQALIQAFSRPKVFVIGTGELFSKLGDNIKYQENKIIKIQSHNPIIKQYGEYRKFEKQSKRKKFREQ